MTGLELLEKLETIKEYNMSSLFDVVKIIYNRGGEVFDLVDVNVCSDVNDGIDASLADEYIELIIE